MGMWYYPYLYKSYERELEWQDAQIVTINGRLKRSWLLDFQKTVNHVLTVEKNSMFQKQRKHYKLRFY